MNRCILALAGATIISACSGARDRPIPAAENSATRPDLTLPDSAALAARGEHPVSPVEQQAAPAPAERKPVTAHPVPPRRKRAARPATPPVDTATHAYAPQAARESLPAPDTVATTKLDTIQTATTGTARTSDTALTRVADTLRSADTLRAADTARTPTTASVATAPAESRTIAVGTEIHAALEESIDSRRDTVGKTVNASITENVTGSDGRTLIAAGTPVQLTITRLTPSKSKGSQGSLVLQVDGVSLNGQLRPVKADIRPVPRELRSRGVTGGDAAKVGVGAAGGAVLGRVLGGSTKGAVIGGVVGAAGGAVVASQTATRDVVVKAKTPLVLVLTEPLTAP